MSRRLRFPDEKRYRAFSSTYNRPTSHLYSPPSPFSIFHHMLHLLHLHHLLLLLLFSPDLFYRRGASTFLCFGRQAEVVVTVWFVESVPEVSCSHDDSPEATVPPTTCQLVRAKLEQALFLLFYREIREDGERLRDVREHTAHSWIEKPRTMTENVPRLKFKSLFRDRAER